jgi:hypothetical protein
MIIKKITDIELNQTDISKAIIYWMLDKHNIRVTGEDMVTFFNRNFTSDYHIDELICQVKVLHD